MRERLAMVVRTGGPPLPGLAAPLPPPPPLARAPAPPAAGVGEPGEPAAEGYQFAPVAARGGISRNRLTESAHGIYYAVPSKTPGEPSGLGSWALAARQAGLFGQAAVVWGRVELCRVFLSLPDGVVQGRVVAALGEPPRARRPPQLLNCSSL